MILVLGKSGSIGNSLKKGVPVASRIEKHNLKELRHEIKEFRPKTFIHLAANTTPKVHSDSDWFLNAESPALVYQMCAELGVEKFLFTSSGHVYGNTIEPAKEDLILNGDSEYARQKIIAETSLKKCAEDYPTKLIIARVFSVFGPNMHPKYLAGRIYSEVKAHKEINVWHSEDVRDFLTPLQVANYLSDLIHCEEQTGNITVNVCSGRPLTLREQIRKTFPNYSNFIFDGKNSQMPYLVGDSSYLHNIV